MRRLLAAVLLFVSCVPAFAAREEDERAANAVKVLDEIMRMPEDAIPGKLLETAHAVAVIPSVVKAGLVVGGRHGKGLIAVRRRDGTWSHPSYIKLTGASVGFQAGVQSTDVVLVFRTPRGVDSIVHGKFTLGADAAVAAGPVGRSAEASTDGQLKAEIYSYSRARGLFAGVALDGAVLSIDHDANEVIYGPNTTPRAAFEGRVAKSSDPIVDFRDRLEEYSAR